MNAAVAAINAVAQKNSQSSDFLNLTPSNSALTAKLRPLQETVSQLTASQHRIDWWLIAFTALIALGLLLEFRSDWREFRVKRRNERTGVGPSEHFETSRDVARTLFGALLVFTGVVGEFWEERLTMGTQTDLETAHSQITLVLSTEANAAEGKITDAKNQAAKATDDAARLGVSQDSLHQFVDDQTQRNNTAVLELKRDTADLNAARIAADKSATLANAALSQINGLLDRQTALTGKITQLTTERRLGRNEWKKIEEALVKLPLERVQINPLWGTDEIMLLDEQLIEMLTAVFKRTKGTTEDKDHVPFVMASPSIDDPEFAVQGVVIEFHSGNAKAQRFAMEFARLLNEFHIAATTRIEPCPNCTPAFFPDPNDAHWATVLIWIGKVPMENSVPSKNQ